MWRADSSAAAKSATCLRCRLISRSARRRDIGRTISYYDRLVRSARAVRLTSRGDFRSESHNGDAFCATRVAFLVLHRIVVTYADGTPVTMWENCFFVANSFTEFLDSLHEDDDDEDSCRPHSRAEIICLGISQETPGTEGDCKSAIDARDGFRESPDELFAIDD